MPAGLLEARGMVTVGTRSSYWRHVGWLPWARCGEDEFMRSRGRDDLHRRYEVRGGVGSTMSGAEMNAKL